MKPQPSSWIRRASPIFLLIGMVFLAIGFTTNNNVFTWVSIAFLVIALVAGGRWSKKK